MKVFNNQARVWIGGRKDAFGNINNAFSGTMSGKLTLNPFMVSGLFYLKSLNWPICNKRGVWLLAHPSYAQDEL